MSGYLFVYFIGENEDPVELEGEQIYMSVSRDGLHWKDLQSKPVLKSGLGMKGVRDPYAVRDPKTGRVYLIATDLRIDAGEGWDTAQYRGSRDIIIWESDDLVHWSKERAFTAAISQAGCAWAPEAIYDESRESFLMYFASMVQLEGDEEPKQRIYARYTKDFKEFTDPFLYIERDGHIIDTTMCHHQGYYYRVSCDCINNRLVVERAMDLLGDFEPVPSDVLDNLRGVEGPAIYQMPNESWCLIADQSVKGNGYLPMITSNLGSEDFEILKDDQYDMGTLKKRHGGVLKITEDEYYRICEEYGLNTYC